MGFLCENGKFALRECLYNNKRSKLLESFNEVSVWVDKEVGESFHTGCCLIVAVTLCVKATGKVKGSITKGLAYMNCYHTQALDCWS